MANLVLPGPRSRRGVAPTTPLPAIGAIVVAMGVVVGVTVGGFLLWAALAGLTSAVSAPGFVSVESHRKTVQHLEGGIVAEIAVRNGDVVKRGEPLVLLEDIRPRTELAILQANYVTLWAAKMRLEAEVAGAERLTFRPELEDMADRVRARHHLENERNIFEARWTELRNREAILHKRIKELEEQASAAAAQQAAVSEQRRLITEELAGTRELFAKGYAPKTKVLALERAAAELQGQAGSLASRVAEARETIAKTRLEILDLSNSRRSAATDELRAVQGDFEKVSEQIAAMEDVLARTVIRAPEDGIVQNLRIHTIGGVLPPGADVLDLVPQRDRLLMDVKVRPEDIDVVHVGQEAETYLVPYEARRVPPVRGVVTYLSADALVEETTGMPYYAARVQLDTDALQGLEADVTLHPGMPVIAMIILSERTVLDYFISPFWRLGQFGMREE